MADTGYLFTGRWPILDDSYTLTQLRVEASQTIDDVAAREGARIVGPVTWTLSEYGTELLATAPARPRPSGTGRAKHGLVAGQVERIRHLAALERVWNLDPNGNPPAAERAVATVTAAWGHNAAGVDRSILGGIGLLYVKYAAEVISGDLIERLARYAGGPNNLVGNARGLAGLLGCTLPNALAEIVVGEYNRRRKTRALNPWRAE